MLAVQDLLLEALEMILLHYLEIALVQQCMKLHAMVAKAAPATLEMQQPIRLVVQAALLALTLLAVNIITLYSF